MRHNPVDAQGARTRARSLQKRLHILRVSRVNLIWPQTLFAHSVPLTWARFLPLSTWCLARQLAQLIYHARQQSAAVSQSRAAGFHVSTPVCTPDHQYCMTFPFIQRPSVPPYRVQLPAGPLTSETCLFLLFQHFLFLSCRIDRVPLFARLCPSERHDPTPPRVATS
jgi:hypothetical protein